MQKLGSVLLMCVCCLFGACAQKKNATGEMIMLINGLEKKILQEGVGEPMGRGKTAQVHYTGWLYDKATYAKGTQFDSSRGRGKSFEFMVGAGMVIKGWDIGVASMKVGEKAELIIDPELGYGSRGAGMVIPPNATLLFEVELLAIK